MAKIINDSKYLNNGYFYFTCNCCDKLILNTKITEKEYNKNNGYCKDCIKDLTLENGKNQN